MDAIDHRLVELLRHNARVPFAELARKVGLSPPAVHERIAKLEQSRVIRAYRTDVAPHAIGLDVTAVVGVVQSAGSDGGELVAAIEQLPEVDACYFTAGEESYLLKVRVATMAALEHLIVRLTKIPGIERTRTTIVLSTKWEDRPAPGPHADHSAAAPSADSADDIDDGAGPEMLGFSRT